MILCLNADDTCFLKTHFLQFSAPTGFKVQTVLMLEEQERAMQADDDDFFEFRRREEKRSWFRRNKKKDYSSKLEKWEACEVSRYYFTSTWYYKTKGIFNKVSRENSSFDYF